LKTPLAAVVRMPVSVLSVNATEMPCSGVRRARASSLSECHNRRGFSCGTAYPRLFLIDRFATTTGLALRPTAG
jgi:hypothetical protein